MLAFTTTNGAPRELCSEFSKSQIIPCIDRKGLHDYPGHVLSFMPVLCPFSILKEASKRLFVSSP